MGLMVMYSLKISAWSQQLQLTVPENKNVSIQWTLTKFLPSRVPQPPCPQVSSGLQAVATGARKVIVPEIYRESYYDKWIAEPRILVVMLTEVIKVTLVAIKAICF